jgi:dihydroorotate dehydrogenase (fumarate)
MTPPPPGSAPGGGGFKSLRQLGLEIDRAAFLEGHGELEVFLDGDTAEDALMVLLAGARIAMLASALLEHGTGHIAEVASGLRTWRIERECESVTQLRGSVGQHAVADPTAFERGNYLRTLRSHASRFEGG